MDRAAKLYHGCCRAHRNDPPVLRQHTEGVIFAGAALYRALQERGQFPEEALAMTDKIFQNFTQDAAEKIRKLLKIPGLYRKVPGIFYKMAGKKYNEAADFQMKFYDTGKYCARFDVLVCPYCSTCKAMGAGDDHCFMQHR